MFKRCCAIVITMILFMSYVFTSSVFVEAASDTIIQSGDWKYIVSADGTAALRKYCGTDEIVKVPSEIDNFRVTKLVDTFYENSYVTNVTIPEGITIIESYAFYGCNRLQCVSISDTVSTIGEYAFYKCVSLESIVIPKGVISLGDNAFYGCYSLKKISLQEGVKSIGHNAFIGCESLQTVIIPESVTSIGQGAFWNCSSLTNVSLPNNITSIVRYLFVGCTSLADIIIPNNVTSIGMQAFDGCSSLTHITIPEKVMDIDYGAFAGCNNLESVQISDLKQWCQIDFGDTTSNPLSRGAGLFLNGIKLEEIVMPDDIDCVGNNVFTGYEDLKSVTIPKGIASIGENAFSLCTNLTSILIPDGATSIGNYAFGGCRRLQSVSIPDSVTSIGRNAFANCLNLKSIVIPEGVKRIETETFYACKSLTSVIIPEGLTSIGEYAFISCSKLENITIPNSVTSIEYAAFAGCSELTSVTVPSGITSIEGAVFSKCNSLTEITIPDTITSIGWHAFYACSELNRIFIPAEVTHIDNYAFTECEQLIIYGIENSYAQDYASTNGILFILDPLIQYDANGGTDAPPTEQPQKGEDFKLSEQIPNRTGYKFLGWSTECDGIVEYTAGDILKDADNIILYAVWEQAYVITYDANGGTDAPDAQTKYNGETLQLTDAIPIMYRHIFKGWSTEANGEIIYMPSSNYETDADITLYAVWDRTFRVVTYDANGGYNAPSEQEKLLGDTLQLSEAIPEREEYVFKGWSASPDGEVLYLPSSSYEVDEDITLYAIWEEGYEIVYEVDGYYDVLDVQIKKKGEPVLLDASLRSGGNRIFVGWATSAEGDVVYAGGALYREDADVTLHAKWITLDTKECSCGNGYLSYDCSSCNSGKITTTYNCLDCAGSGKLEKEKEMTAQCQICHGIGLSWSLSLQTYVTCAFCSGTGEFTYTDIVEVQCSRCSGSGIGYRQESCPKCSGTGKYLEDCPNCPSAGMIVLNNQYYLTYNANGGENAPWGKTRYVGESVCISLETPVRSRHTFEGWSLQADGEVIYQPGDTYLGEKSATLYAVWSENECQDNAHIFSCNEGLTCEYCGFSKQPQMPQLESKTNDSITLVINENYEYSIDGEIWQDSNVFTGLEEDTTYTFYQRIKESTVALPSEKSEGLTIYLEKKQPQYILGDCNNDNHITDADAEWLLMYTFFPGDYPVNQRCDYNGDGKVNDADAEHLLMYTFFPEDYPLSE